MRTSELKSGRINLTVGVCVCSETYTMLLHKFGGVNINILRCQIGKQKHEIFVFN